MHGRDKCFGHRVDSASLIVFNPYMMVCLVSGFSVCAQDKSTLGEAKSMLGKSRTFTRRSWQWGSGMLDLPSRVEQTSAPQGSCSLLGYGLATPGKEHLHTQAAVAKMLKVPQDSWGTHAHVALRATLSPTEGGERF